MRQEVHELHELQVTPLIRRALEEEWGTGDWSTDLCVARDAQARARVIARETCVVAGVDVARTVLKNVDPELTLELRVANGDVVKQHQVIMDVSGSARSILRAEKVAMNFLGRLSGIATMTRAFVDELVGTRVQLLDARDSTPGFRIFEKSATVIGGARNHRFGLCDGVVVKENHVRAAGGMKTAIARLRESLSPTLKIEVEAATLDDVQMALDAGADLIILNNMSLAETALAVRTSRRRALLESTGNISLENVRQIADTGVDFISAAGIIHSSRWSDLQLQFDV